MHDETHKHTIICNDKYKFAAYPHSIAQEFTVKNMVMVTIHSERFPLRTVSQLLTRCICHSKVPRRIIFITDELNFSWDSGVSSVCSATDLTLSAACAFPDLSSTASHLHEG